MVRLLEPVTGRHDGHLFDVEALRQPVMLAIG